VDIGLGDGRSGRGLVQRGAQRQHTAPKRWWETWRPLRLIGLIVAGLLLAALLNADHLEDRADKMPFGAERDFWLSIWRPVQAVSDALLLNRPRQWLDDLTDREITKPNLGLVNQPPPTQTTGPGNSPTPDQATPTPQAGQSPSPGASPTPEPTATSTPTAAEPAVRVPTAENPIKMFIAGDSMAVSFGGALSRMASETGLITPELDARASTGLSRPDFYDWPTRLNDVAQGPDADVMVVIFGANDSQGVKTPDGEIFQPLSDGWRAEYRRRVSGTMDLITAPNRLVVWVGQPVMEGEDFSARMADINEIYRSEAAKRSGIVFFDSWPLFTDEDGNYAAYLPDGDGADQLMRAGDGIHLSLEGSDRLARAVLDRINEDVRIYP
jgi:hypothetical protein